MNQIQLTITAKSPLALGRKKPGSVSEAADFISGSVIRGAIASQILRYSSGNNQPEPGDDFSKLFVEENAAIFSNAYPSQDNADVKVLPTTAVSAKAKPGFKAKGYGVFDTLIDRFCAESFGQLYDPNCPEAINEGDDGRVEPFGGFYTRSGNSYASQSVAKRLLTRVGINRRRGTAEEKILYSLEVLNESQPCKSSKMQGNQSKSSKKQKQPNRVVNNSTSSSQPVVYYSSIFVEDNTLAAHLTEFINRHANRFRVGGGASRGLGRIQVKAKSANVQSSFQQRFHNFNTGLNQRWKMWRQLYGDRHLPSSQFFTLNLQADAIFTDNWKRTTVVTPEMLQQFAGVADDSLRLYAAYSSYDTVSGWNSAWGLMKDIDLITSKGGLYLFGTDNGDRWGKALADLEVRGIGDRTLEGFGQIEVCNEFHQVFRENAV